MKKLTRKQKFIFIGGLTAGVTAISVPLAIVLSKDSSPAKLAYEPLKVSPEEAKMIKEAGEAIKQYLGTLVGSGWDHNIRSRGFVSSSYWAQVFTNPIYQQQASIETYIESIDGGGQVGGGMRAFTNIGSEKHSGNTDVLYDVDANGQLMIDGVVSARSKSLDDISKMASTLKLDYKQMIKSFQAHHFGIVDECYLSEELAQQDFLVSSELKSISERKTDMENSKIWQEAAIQKLKHTFFAAFRPLLDKFGYRFEEIDENANYVRAFFNSCIDSRNSEGSSKNYKKFLQNYEAISKYQNNLVRKQALIKKIDHDYNYLFEDTWLNVEAALKGPTITHIDDLINVCNDVKVLEKFLTEASHEYPIGGKFSSDGQIVKEYPDKVKDAIDKIKSNKDYEKLYSDYALKVEGNLVNLDTADKVKEQLLGWENISEVFGVPNGGASMGLGMTQILKDMIDYPEDAKVAIEVLKITEKYGAKFVPSLTEAQYNAMLPDATKEISDLLANTLSSRENKMDCLVGSTSGIINAVYKLYIPRISTIQFPIISHYSWY